MLTERDEKLATQGRLKEQVKNCQSCQVDDPEEAEEGDLCPECEEDWAWWTEEMGGPI